MMNRCALVRRSALAGLLLALVGCASAPQTLYGWGNYQNTLYEHLKTDGGDLRVQIKAIEAQVAANKAAAKADPPGLHAHLGLLYGKAGDDAAARVQLQIERSLFPESATYVDFLMKKGQQPQTTAKEASNG